MGTSHAYEACTEASLPNARINTIFKTPDICRSCSETSGTKSTRLAVARPLPRGTLGAIRSRLPALNTARLLIIQIDRILKRLSSLIILGPVEGFNSRIQAIKSAAGGFRIFEHYQIWILFFCGILGLKPSEISPRISQKKRI